MKFDEYQTKAITTDQFKKTDNASSVDLVNKVLGLMGESGEVAEKIKKIQRNKNGVMDDLDKKEISKELGDVLWYLSAIAYYLDIPLSKVAQNNLNKLFDRKDRGVIKSQGDNR